MPASPSKKTGINAELNVEISASPAPGARQRPPSPLSPTKMSWTQEKRKLGALNSRLAAYIERVRTLEVVYDKRIQDLNSKLASERGSAASAIQEMKEMNTKVQGMTSKVTELEATNSALTRRMKEL